MIHIDLVNASTVVKDQDLATMVAALQKQVSGPFAAAWGIDATLRFVPRGDRPSADAWWIAVLDDSDVADALGYHDITKAGQPLGKVFARTDLQAGSSISVTLSHETCEMLGDPDVNLIAFVEQGQHAGMYAYETADPVEADNLGQSIDGVLLSDFVYPSYFESFRKAGPFDWCGHVKKPLEILPGGYQAIYVPGKGWTQVTAQGHPTTYAMLAKRGSRRERRRRARELWLASTVATM